jgi:fructose-1,6-bisphosphatase/inositol monophosphatase family enzyme
MSAPPVLPDDTTRRALRRTAAAAVCAAGEVHRQYAGATLRVDAAHAHDLKLEVDRLAEAAMLAVIRESFPDHAVLAEESGAHAGTGDAAGAFRWILDPLDGTVNYFHGIPYHSACAACCRAPAPGVTGLAALGEPLAAAIYASGTDELFEAEAGGAARLNAEPVSASRAADLSETLVGVSLGSAPEVQERMQRVLRALAPRARKVRALGSTGLDLANVACGRLGGLVQARVRSWDIAAGRILVEAAGGVFTAEPAREGEDAWAVVAAGAPLHAALARILETA